MDVLSFPVSSLYIGLHGLFAVFLANFVLYVRLRSNKAPEWQPDAVLRVQANFVENVPLALLLLFLIEVQGAPPEFVHVFGAALFLCRLMHAYGLGTKEGNYPRLICLKEHFNHLNFVFCCVTFLIFLNHIRRLRLF